MNKTICVNVVWEKTGKGESLFLKTHDCTEIRLAFINEEPEDTMLNNGFLYRLADNCKNRLSNEKTFARAKQAVEITIFGKPLDEAIEKSGPEVLVEATKKLRAKLLDEVAKKLESKK